MDVGFIGLGAMGAPMAAHLAGAGHRLHLWARRPEACAALAAHAPVVHATPAALGAAVEVAFTMLTADADVEQVVCGADGLAAGLRAGSALVEMSTIAPATARRLAAALAAQGAGMLDAPVSGGAAGARAASLAIMVGGEAALLERLRPLLACLGARIVHIGPSGAGQVAKACNQMLMVSLIEAVAEAMHLATAHGVDLARVQAALSGGSAASRVLDLMGGRMVARDFSAGVEARLHHKDFAIVMNEARALGLALPVAASVSQQLNALMALGWGRDDTASLLKVLERLGPPL